ncbi:LLM class F420-dependent oxidoreductase [Streptomyces vinaceus]|uniref:LLM class F420-dependent oxidoreductase n=1 Tax=Streptomyces vinaceus TaxID=1960 RepID=A0A5J6JEU4_STRVI|nr:LLM class F420-dependent oxidoreductase [Streptomyces vinaceus]QEV48483.1 LLM class F420-dependent oxidoreductase [Streptomyces vinaceus]GHE74480.1 LLM class F420-dependent oxidoreductase [Streptomyces vinaceus]
MQVSMQLQYDVDAVESARRVSALEAAGLDLVWVPEAYGYDAPSFMGYIAARTERVQIGSGIMPLFTRTPTLLAMTAAGVDALSQGRCHVGLGASGPGVIEGWHGVPFTDPLGRTRETVEIMRKVWRREGPLRHDGRAHRLPLPAPEGSGMGTAMRLLTPPVRDSVPVWVAALGPRNVRLTAEIAEGWLPMFFVPEWADGVWGEDLRAGLAKRDRSLGPLRISAGGLLAIGPRAHRVRERARRQLALFIGAMGAPGHNFYDALIRRYGFGREADAIQQLYTAGDRAAAEAAVPDRLLEATTLCGSEEYVKDRLAAYRAAGVTHVQVSPVPDDGQTEAGLVSRIKELCN